MIIRNKGELIKALWDDWKKHDADREDSIIYRYFEELKNSNYTKVDIGDIEAYLLSDEAEKTRIRKKYGKYTFSKAYEAIYNKKPEDITETDRELLYSLVNNFFRNEGITTPWKKDPALQKSVRGYKREERKPGYIDNVNLTYYYLVNTGEDKSSADTDKKSKLSERQIDNASYILKCEVFYKGMLKTKKSRICFLPLYVDSYSYSGVFLLGSSYFEDGDLLEKNCYPCILSLEDVGVDEDIVLSSGDFDSDPNVKLTSDELGGLTLHMHPKVFTSVEEAFRYLRSFVNVENEDAESPLSGFRDVNYQYPETEDHDHIFKPYFGEQLKKHKKTIDAYRQKELTGITSMKLEDKKKENINRVINGL